MSSEGEGIMEGIQVSVEKVGPQSDVSIIRVGGYIDTTTSSELERALDSLLKAGVYRIIIDLGSVDYISSAGWGIFISEIKGIRERGGDLKLARMIPDVYEVFELLEFHYILKAFDSVEEAIGDFGDVKGVLLEDQTAEQKPAARDGLTEEEEASLSEASMGVMDAESLDDKVKEIALSFPSWGPQKIVKELNTEKHGFIRVNSITVWKTLRKLDLGSKKRRQDLSDELE